MAPSSIPSICTTSFTLNDGTKLPAVGLGTWQGQPGTKDGEALKASIIHALECGYRLIDTAQGYGVEAVVGDAIRSSGIPRSEITVITKFPMHWHHDVATALKNSLRELDVEYIDIFLMHWPTAMTPDGKNLPYPGKPPYWETWKEMEGLLGPELKGIGVSNFSQKTLNELLKHAKVVPVVNQVELHALNPNHNLVPYCHDKGIRVISWSTLGGQWAEGAKNPNLTNPLFVDIAKARGVSVGVVSLSWAVQRDIVVIPKSSSLSRIEENIKLVTLTDEEMDKINQAHLTIGKLRLADDIPGLEKEVDGKKTLLGWTRADFGWEDEQGNWLV